MMKANELRDKTTAELEAQLTSLKKDLFFLRMLLLENANKKAAAMAHPRACPMAMRACDQSAG